MDCEEFGRETVEQCGAQDHAPDECRVHRIGREVEGKRGRDALRLGVGERLRIAAQAAGLGARGQCQQERGRGALQRASGQPPVDRGLSR